MESREQKIASLRSEISSLELELTSLLLPDSSSLESATQDDDDTDNPYSRLVALQKMHVVEDYVAVRSKTVAVVGIGGIGSVACEMLTRCGVGRLILFDFDIVSVVNMNRLFFFPTQIGLSKVEAARETLHKINPSVVILTQSYNVTSVAEFETFKETLSTNETDLVLCCVDNFEARIAVNRACLALDLPWIESGVSESAVSGHIQFMLPGSTACYECAPPLVVATKESQAPREGVCAASLATTMGVIAGLLVQNALKFLLRFGNVCSVVGYDALLDFFPTYPVLPNPECSNLICREHQKRVESTPPQQTESETVEEGEGEEEEGLALHGSNSWGIEIVGRSENAVEEVPSTSLKETKPSEVHGSVTDLMSTLEALQFDD